MFPNCVNKFPPVPAHSKIARKNFHRFRHVPRLREQISTGSGMFPNCANKFPLVPAHSQTARTNFRSFRHVPRPARRDFRSVLESYWVLTGNLLRQICAFYMLSALSPRTLYICAMGGGNRCRVFTFRQSRYGKGAGQAAFAPRFGRSLS